jgi:hypothetical protein
MKVRFFFISKNKPPDSFVDETFTTPPAVGDEIDHDGRLWKIERRVWNSGQDVYLYASAFGV